ncbi:unnamed protein product [Polarella glacialis]|uniref:Uncharacterized protein n=1 Tax=Polarella glacialis TaxID=89957 RepID=A0A813LPR0_POLGL|nr:unnamed protein product [Polarella glacialis]
MWRRSLCPMTTTLLTARGLPFARQLWSYNELRSVSASSFPQATISLADLGSFAQAWYFQAGVRQDPKVITAQMVIIVRDCLEIPGASGKTCLPLSDAAIILEEVGIPAESTELADFATALLDDLREDDGTRNTQEDVPDAGKLSFLAWCAEHIQSCKDATKFASARGARVINHEAGAAVKISGVNACHAILQKDTTKVVTTSKGSEGAYWKDVHSKLWQMGLRLELADGEPREWCAYCSRERGFRVPKDIKECTSTHSSCRREEGESWKQKLT